MKIAMLAFMLIAHSIDDYVLQGWLGSAKQKKWWEENAPDRLYRHDWAMAMLCHCLSWSLMITLPIIIHSLCCSIELGWFWLSVPVNLIIHFVVDDLKANRHAINLMADQYTHFVQIVLTWLIWLFAYQM